MTPKRIVIAGGSGFIGRALAKAFSARGYAVVILTRSPRERADSVKEILWDAQSVGDWAKPLDGAAAVINLTGKNINCPHTPENVRGIIASRVEATRVLAAVSAQSPLPPPVWVQASAIGFYGDTGGRLCDETSPSGNDSLARICREWEADCESAVLPSTRKVILRVGVVLGVEGGALPVLVRITKLFLGGAAGSGRQFVSWIHLDDLVAMFVAAVENPGLSGTFNAVAPAAVTNAELMRGLRRVLRRPWSPPAPVFGIKLGAKIMGSEPSLALISQRVAPGRLLQAGFSFHFPELGPALENLLIKN